MPLNRGNRGAVPCPLSPAVKLLSDDHLLRLERHLADRLPRALGGSEDGTLAEFGPIARAVVDHVLRGGGKRVRPQLCCWTCGLFGGDATSEAALDVACGWELFHAFLLVHDDIIDASARRRGRPSLHRALAALDGDSAIFGTNLGIVAGDLLFAAAMRLWHGIDEEADDDLPPETRRRLLRLTGRVAVETGAGQAADVTFAHTPVDRADERAVLAGYHAKTAAYTFEGPMLCGAILAGAADADRGRIRRFATALGRAYQLQNDLIDLAAPAVLGGDLEQGKRTVTLLRGWHASDDGGRRAMRADLREIEAASPDRLAAAERLRCRLHDVGAVDSTRRLVADLLADAESAAVGLAPGVRGLLETLRASYFAG